MTPEQHKKVLFRRAIAGSTRGCTHNCAIVRARLHVRMQMGEGCVLLLLGGRGGPGLFSTMLQVKDSLGCVDAFDAVSPLYA